MAEAVLLGVKFCITIDRLVYTLCIYNYIICRFHHDISDQYWYCVFLFFGTC